jgi:CheY-like chemotaxis protein
MRILIADDDLASRTLLKGLLEKDGYEVQVAANAPRLGEHYSGVMRPSW